MSAIAFAPRYLSWAMAAMPYERRPCTKLQDSRRLESAPSRHGFPSAMLMLKLMRIISAQTQEGKEVLS